MNFTKDWFTSKINEFLTNDPSNKMSLIDGSLIFEPNALVGVAAGDDPIFEQYKNIIGKFHLTPAEVFQWYSKKNDLWKKVFPAEDLSVVAFILPINKETKKQHEEFSSDKPSERWAHTRLFGEQANEKLQKFLVDELLDKGIPSVAPAIEKEIFRMIPKHENGVWASPWSHRHAAFASGLGSFGLSDGFISERGIAMRCGSLVVDYKLPSDAKNRPENPYEYCNNCGTCAERCPASAITKEKRHDKLKCAEFVFGTTSYIKERYNINIYACGLCQVGVPCENGIPKRKNDSKEL